MGPKLPDVSKKDAQQVRSGTLWEAAEYLVPVAHFLALYRPSHLYLNFSYGKTFKWTEVESALP
jgi:hypothetical protein